MVYTDLAISDTLYVNDIDAITQKIKLLLQSIQGDWFFCRDFDCDLREYLFGNLEVWHLTAIKLKLKNCFLKYVPEITLLDETDISIDATARLYKLKLVFSVKGLDDIYSLDESFTIIQR